MAGGPSQVIASTKSGPINTVVRCSRAPAGLSVLAEQPLDHKQIIFSELDPLKGRGKELLRFDTDPAGVYHWALSPDATRIAILKPSEKRVPCLTKTP